MKKSYLILPLLFATFLTGCSNQAEVKPDIPDPSIKILMLDEKPSYEVSEIGQIRASQEIELIAKATGTIGELQVGIGEEVLENQTIAVINFDESDSLAKVNFDNAKNQLSNAQVNQSRIQANNQDSITRSNLRLRTLRETLKRIERNLVELRVSNESIKKTYELQLENAEKNANTAQVNLDNLKAQFEQSWLDLFKSTETGLNGIFTSLELNFDTAETIVNPDNRGYFNSNDIQSGLGAGKSITRNTVANAYNLIKNTLPAGKIDYLDKTPLNSSTINSAISKVRTATEEMLLFTSNVREMLNRSVESSQLSEASITTYKSTIAAMETGLITSMATINALEKALADFKLNRVSQTATAENNAVISSNQLADAGNALIQFGTTSAGNTQDLESQIFSTKNEILSSEADLASVQRSAGISNSSSNLELSTLNNQLRSAEKSLDDNRVNSSIKGVLSEFTVDAGDYVSVGTYLGKVIQYKAVKVVFYLSKETAEKLNITQVFEFTVADSKNENFTGYISKISPAADPINKKIRIEGVIDNQTFFLKPEMYINLKLDLSTEIFEANKIYVPMNSIIFTQNDQYVFVVEENVAIKRSVKIGKIFGSWVEINDGLTKKDVVITEGQRNLPPDGDIKINIVN